MSLDVILLRFLATDILRASAETKLPAAPIVPGFARLTLRPSKGVLS